jgi:acetylornithine deacetylase
VIVTALRQLGIDDVKVVGQGPGRPNVIARVRGRGGGRSLIFNGHIDTRPPGDLDAWNSPPWEPVVRDGYLYGLGSADMKGAVAAMIHAAAEVARAEVVGDLILVFTADEEVDGNGARWLAEQGFLAADAAIIGEPGGITNDWEAIHLISRGVCVFRVTLSGTPMHSSLSDRLPSVNANVAMSRLIARFAAEASVMLKFPAHPVVVASPTMNPALVATGGVGYGVLPSTASFISDIRVVPGMTREQVQNDIDTFLERAAMDDPDLEAEFSIEHWHPPCEIDATHPVVTATVAAARDVLGKTLPFGVFPGGTDAPFFRLIAGIPTVPSFGPGLLTAAHRPNECISTKSIEDATAIYAGTAVRFLDA